MHRWLLALIIVLVVALPVMAYENIFLRIDASTPEERTVVANTGVDITYVNVKEGWLIAEVPPYLMNTIKSLGMPYSKTEEPMRFPPGYDAYHSYSEQIAELQSLHATYPDITSLFTIGKSLENRDLWCLKISDNPENNETDEGGIFIVAQHHAREILTPEVALYTAKTLLESYGNDEMMTALINNREIFIVTTINPDGAEFDQSGNSFKLWRKNRRVNEGWPAACMGVDLNRNYSYHWGEGGSTNVPCGETYHGVAGFSEPETQAVRDFVSAHANIHTIVSLHSYAELDLYPWGYSYQHVSDQTDYLSFAAMAQYMASQNGYTPMQESSLYIASGGTDDWAYGDLGIFSFTIELEGMGFYPLPSIIQPACEKNYNAIFYPLALARDPHLVLSTDLWKFQATLNGLDALIEWASLIETKPQGWNLLKSESADGPFTAINSALIPPGQDLYSVTDPGLTPGNTYYYKVEYISDLSPDLNQQFGPLAVEVPSTDDDSGDDDTADDDIADDDITDDDEADDDAGDDDAADDSTDDDSGDDDSGNQGSSTSEGSSNSGNCGC